MNAAAAIASMCVYVWQRLELGISAGEVRAHTAKVKIEKSNSKTI